MSVNMFESEMVRGDSFDFLSIPSSTNVMITGKCKDGDMLCQGVVQSRDHLHSYRFQTSSYCVKLFIPTAILLKP